MTANTGAIESIRLRWKDASRNYEASRDIHTLLARVDTLTRERDAARTALETEQKDTGTLKGMLQTISDNAPDDHTPPAEVWKWKFWVAGQAARLQLAAFAKRDANAAALAPDDRGA